MSEQEAIKVHIDNLEKGLDENKQSVIRHKTEVLSTMQTYMNAMKDVTQSLMNTFEKLIIQMEERHKEDMKEMKNFVLRIENNSQNTNNTIVNMRITMAKYIGIATLLLGIFQLIFPYLIKILLKTN